MLILPGEQQTTGVGKASVVREAINSIFEGADLITIEVNLGTGFVELALALKALVRNEELTESLNEDQLKTEIRLCIETVAKDARLLFFSLAQTLRAHLEKVDKVSVEFVGLLPATFRMFAMSGDLKTARALRRDLSGELEATAILLYNRRDYALADECITHVLDDHPDNWCMRLYRARIRIRQEEWSEADSLLAKMSAERPNDIGVLYTMGWRQLRAHNLSLALEKRYGRRRCTGPGQVKIAQAAKTERRSRDAVRVA